MEREEEGWGEELKTELFTALRQMHLNSWQLVFANKQLLCYLTILRNIISNFKEHSLIVHRICTVFFPTNYFIFALVPKCREFGNLSKNFKVKSQNLLFWFSKLQDRFIIKIDETFEMVPLWSMVMTVHSWPFCISHELPLCSICCLRSPRRCAHVFLP